MLYKINFSTILVIVFLMTSLSFASDYKSSEDFISTLSSETLNIIKSRETEEKKSKKLEAIFDESVDSDWMAKFAIARFWKTMTDQEKKDYLNAYKHYLLKTYIPRFKEYNNQIIKIVNTKDMGNGQYMVSTQIITHKGTEKQTINIGYRCKQDGNTFKIRDIVGEDFSLLATQRSEFSSVIANSGIKELIKTLIAK